jgi:hypothetical protein
MPSYPITHAIPLHSTSFYPVLVLFALIPIFFWVLTRPESTSYLHARKRTPPHFFWEKKIPWPPTFPFRPVYLYPIRLAA